MKLPFLIFLFTASGIAFGQSPTETPFDSEGVVKITSKIVQMDVLVLDKNGKQSRDLGIGDFEVYQDGKPQKIVGFSYIDRTTKLPQQPAVKGDVKKDGSIPPPIKITPANAGRVISFIVDDGSCSASMIGMRASREGIEKFIREQMEPTDLVAIYKTRSGSSVFQQYTNDKAQLLKAASKVRWTPPMGSCSNDGSFYEAAKTNNIIKLGPEGTSTVAIESPEDKKSRERNEDQVANNQVVGSLGMMRYVVQGLSKVPGRKIVFLMSDGLPVRSRSGERLSSADVLRDLTDLANRASVVFNSIDVRGIFDPRMIEARDEVYADEDAMTATTLIGDERENAVNESRTGLDFIAHETGGKLFKNSNFLDAPIKKALSVETGYYLIAYEPDDESFKSKRFNRIEVKVKTEGLKVVSRTGFLGYVTQEAKPKIKTENSELYDAIASPLPVPGMNVELTAFYGNSAEAGNFVRSFFHIDGREIKFVDDTNGIQKATFDVVAVTMNEKNAVVDEFTRTHTLKLPAAAMPTVLQNGLVYSTDVPVKKTGIYNFRVAIRDGNSKVLGSAVQMVSIPDLKKTGLYLSGLSATEADSNGKFEIPGPTTAQTAFSLPRTPASSAIRKFTKGATLAFSYMVYNAKLDPATNKPKLTVQMNLYKDGKIVLEGAVQSAELQDQTDWTRINDFGYLKLRPDIEGGEYTMQVIVKDVSPSAKKNSASSQWIDFTILD